MTELGSATVQVWARKRDQRRGFEAAMAKIDEAILQNDLEFYGPPKPWLQDAIWKWWKGEG